MFDAIRDDESISDAELRAALEEFCKSVGVEMADVSAAVIGRLATNGPRHMADSLAHSAIESAKERGAKIEGSERELNMSIQAVALWGILAGGLSGLSTKVLIRIMRISSEEVRGVVRMADEKGESQTLTTEKLDELIDRIVKVHGEEEEEEKEDPFKDCLSRKVN
jgi:hypothetical protein